MVWSEPLVEDLGCFAALLHFKEGLVDKVDKIRVTLTHTESIWLVGDLDVRYFKLSLVWGFGEDTGQDGFVGGDSRYFALLQRQECLRVVVK